MKKWISLVAVLVLMMNVLPLNGAFAAQEEVNVYNWEDYMNPEVFKIFEQETGIHVNEMFFTTNEEMYTKLLSGASYDVIVPSERYDEFVDELHSLKGFRKHFLLALGAVDPSFHLYGNVVKITYIGGEIEYISSYSLQY